MSPFFFFSGFEFLRIYNAKLGGKFGMTHGGLLFRWHKRLSWDEKLPSSFFNLLAIDNCNSESLNRLIFLFQVWDRATPGQVGGLWWLFVGPTLSQWLTEHMIRRLWLGGGSGVYSDNNWLMKKDHLWICCYKQSSDTQNSNYWQLEVNPQSLKFIQR